MRYVAVMQMAQGKYIVATKHRVKLGEILRQGEHLQFFDMCYASSTAYIASYPYSGFSLKLHKRIYDGASSINFSTISHMAEDQILMAGARTNEANDRHILSSFAFLENTEWVDHVFGY